LEVLEILGIIGTGLWLFLPALISNPTAVTWGKWFPAKIDFGKSWRGNRIFGDGKSWGGLIGGGLTGVAGGLLLIAISSIWDPENYFGYGPFWANVGIIACISFGALLGDLCGAFIKRRLGMERGQKAPILDQYDLVFGSFVTTAIFFPNWVYEHYFEEEHIFAFLFILAIMYAVHRSANIIAYKIGIKKEPW